MKLFSDYHSHPQGHRIQPYTPELLQPWVDSAREKGLREIAFTDHDRYHEGIDLDVLDLVRQANPDVALRAGIELDNDPQTGAAGLAWVEKNWDRLDFVLGSAHYLAGKDRMLDSADQTPQFAERPLEEICRDYIAQVEGMIARGHIDCLAHLDLVKIHGFRPEAPLLEFFDPLLQRIKKAGLAMEVNTAGWRKPVGEQYPEIPLLRRAVELEIPITLSSDAHSHVQLAEDYHRLPAVLEAAGVREIALYEKHRRTIVPLA
ncbi:MAG: PHP domain-containing protein [Verrucomicrobium sp.]|nr:PHP domain-containing protein [Verrucomicrobium sp.]